MTSLASEIGRNDGSSIVGIFPTKEIVLHVLISISAGNICADGSFSSPRGLDQLGSTFDMERCGFQLEKPLDYGLSCFMRLFPNSFQEPRQSISINNVQALAENQKIGPPLPQALKHLLLSSLAVLVLCLCHPIEFLS